MEPEANGGGLRNAKFSRHAQHGPTFEDVESDGEKQKNKPIEKTSDAETVSSPRGHLAQSIRTSLARSKQAKEKAKKAKSEEITDDGVLNRSTSEKSVMSLASSLRKSTATPQPATSPRDSKLAQSIRASLARSKQEKEKAKAKAKEKEEPRTAESKKVPFDMDQVLLAENDSKMPQVRTLKNGMKAFIISNCIFDEGLKETLASKRESTPKAKLDMSAKKQKVIEDQQASRSVPSIQIWVTVEVGSAMEEEHESGFAHLVEHLLFECKEKKSMKNNNIFKHMEQMGIAVGVDANALTHRDHTDYFLACYFEDEFAVGSQSYALTQEILDILFTMTTTLNFTDKGLATELRIVDNEELEGRLDSLASDDMAELPYKGTSYYNKPPIGKREIRNRANRESVMKFFYKWYRPDRMTVTVIGDIGGPAEVELMLNTIEAKFGQFSGANTSIYQVEPGGLPDYFQRANQKGRDVSVMFEKPNARASKKPLSEGEEDLADHHLMNVFFSLDRESVLTPRQQSYYWLDFQLMRCFALIMSYALTGEGLTVTTTLDACRNVLFPLSDSFGVGDFACFYVRHDDEFELRMKRIFALFHYLVHSPISAQFLTVIKDVVEDKMEHHNVFDRQTMENHEGLISGLFSPQFIFDTSCTAEDMLAAVMDTTRPVLPKFYERMKVELRYSATVHRKDLLSREQLEKIIDSAGENYDLIGEHVLAEVEAFYKKMDNNFHFEPPADWDAHVELAQIHSDQITVHNEDTVTLECYSPLGFGSVTVKLNFYEGDVYQLCAASNECMIRSKIAVFIQHRQFIHHLQLLTSLVLDLGIGGISFNLNPTLESIEVNYLQNKFQLNAIGSAGKDLVQMLQKVYCLFHLDPAVPIWDEEAFNKQIQKYQHDFDEALDLVSAFDVDPEEDFKLHENEFPFNYSKLISQQTGKEKCGVIQTAGLHQFCVDFLRELFCDMRYWEFTLMCPNYHKKEELGFIIETVNLYFSHLTHSLWNLKSEADCKVAAQLVMKNIKMALLLSQEQLFQKTCPPVKILALPKSKVTMSRISITFTQSRSYERFEADLYLFANLGLFQELESRIWNAGREEGIIYSCALKSRRKLPITCFRLRVNCDPANTIQLTRLILRVINDAIENGLTKEDIANRNKICRYQAIKLAPEDSPKNLYKFLARKTSAASWVVLLPEDIKNEWNKLFAHQISFHSMDQSVLGDGVLSRLGNFASAHRTAVVATSCVLALSAAAYYFFSSQKKS